MKLFFQAVQAVTVEMFGVLLIVWMLFGFASWGLRSTAGSELKWTPIAATVAAGQHQAQSEKERTEYVARRLNHYGQMLDMASKRMWRRTWAHLDM